jgi:hypothetical protein
MCLSLKLSCLLGLVMMACGSSKYPVQAYDQLPASAPDYHQLSYWAAHPKKWDPSDSTPRPYRGDVPDSSVAVFYIHPTTYMQQDAVANEPATGEKWNASFDDTHLNAKTDYTALLNQASAFNSYPLYAPRYRQAHITSFYLADSIAAPIFDKAYSDVRSAFSHFLEYELNGRPFIIASHSQGTLHAARLIKEMIDGWPLQKKMVAAYIIGLPIRQDYFDSCKPCRQAADVNCFVSWRTFKNGYIPEYIRKENFRAVVTNPISWRSDVPAASRSLHKGAVLYHFNKPKSKNVSAQVEGNLLWCTKPRFFGNLFFIRKSYHIGDINLFWKDIRENLTTRVNAYFRAAHL